MLSCSTCSRLALLLCVCRVLSESRARVLKMISIRLFDRWITCLVLAAAAVSCVSCNSEVTESVCDYSCCTAELQFNRECEITFSANGTNFAFFKDETRSCTYPCRKLRDGAMRLEECAAVVAVTVCTDKMNVVEEKIWYRSQPCPRAVSEAPGNQAVTMVTIRCPASRLLLMTSMIGTLIVKKLVC